MSAMTQWATLPGTNVPTISRSVASTRVQSHLSASLSTPRCPLLSRLLPCVRVLVPVCVCCCARQAMDAVASKGRLCEALLWYQQLYPDDFDFFPNTWLTNNNLKVCDLLN